MTAALFSGGCGGSGGGVQEGYNPYAPESEDVEPYTPESYSGEIADILASKSNVYDLAVFINDPSALVKKGDILLYYPEDSKDITASADLLARVEDALEAGAVLAFIDIRAEEIDKFTDKLSLNLPSYLPENATSEEKKEIEDFYAVAMRADSDDPSVANAYSYLGVELVSDRNAMTITMYSGDSEVAFNPNDYTTSPDLEYEYVDENGNVLSSDPNPMNYDHAQSVVDGFMDWVSELNKLKAVDETYVSGSMRAASDDNGIFPGVSTTFAPVLHVEPRNYYFTTSGKRKTFTHKAWHRDTSMTFNIIPVHRFSDGADFYIIRVTGNTDPSTQYAHLSFMARFLRDPIIVEGMDTDKSGVLVCDNILGYNNAFEFSSQIMANPKVSGDKLIEGTAVGTLHSSAPDTLNSSKTVSNGFSFSIEGNVSGGISQKDGAKAEASVNYRHL